LNYLVPVRISLAVVVLLLASCQPPREFDLIITNAKVYDGSGSPAIVQDVGINADTIAFLGDLDDAVADTLIDAGGFALAPGFIDAHSHHDRGLQRDPGATAAVSQGITTIIVGQDGGSSYPLGDYYRLLNDSPAAVNVGSYSGHNTLRDIVMGSDFKRIASDAEIDSMIMLLRADMEAGALGLSTGLEYDPGIYSDRVEVLSLAKAAAEYDGRYISHLRSEDRFFWDALNEIITIGKETGMPVQISHFKLAMRGLWGKADSVIAMLDSARQAGVNITADIYPYAYWSSTIRVLFPERNFTDIMEARFILKEVTTPEGIIFSNYEPNPEYNGKSLLEAAAAERKAPAKLLLELIERLAECDRESAGGCSGSIVATSMSEPDIAKLMNWEFTSICSDGASAGRHPRGYGAFTRVLGHYVREEEALDWETAIYKMTSLSARNLGIERRGLIKPGYYADLVIFDPDVVKDESTIAEPQKVSAGIRKVFVNGVEVFGNGQASGKYPGKVILRKSTPAVMMASWR
jgi:N-acyl-D-amino-acid deacylase